MGRLRSRLADPLNRTLRKMHRDPAYAPHTEALQAVRTSPKLFDTLSGDVEGMLKQDGSAQMMMLSLDEEGTSQPRLRQMIAAAVQKLWAHREEILAFVLKIFALASAASTQKSPKKK